MSWLGKLECGCVGECENEPESIYVTIRPQESCGQHKGIDLHKLPENFFSTLNRYEPDLRVPEGI